MKTKSKKSIVALLAFAMLVTSVTGCSNKNGDVSNVSGVNYLTQYGKTITVDDIKKQYDFSDENSIMPLYNVASDEKFEIAFNFIDTCDINISLEDYVSVHTDKDCKEESAIYTYNTPLNEIDEKFKLSIAPIEPVLATDSEDKENLDSNIAKLEDKDKDLILRWGNAPIYYLAIWYDTESETPVKLDKPVIIPFTVKQEIEVPNVKGVVDSQGVFKLTWDAVEGAEEYIIYKLVSDNQSFGLKNDPVLGAKAGYSEESLISVHRTTKTEYADSRDGDGRVYFESRSSDNVFVIGQNFSIEGDYYVSAVVGGKESGLGAGVSTADLKLPMKITNEYDDIVHSRFEKLEDLPMTFDVLNIDGSVTSRNVKYTYFIKEIYGEYTSPCYKYEVEGTALTGYISMANVAEGTEFPETIGDTTFIGNAEPENNINKVPDKDVDTIISSDDKKPDEDKTIVEQQKENTDNHVETGNEDTVDNPNNGMMIFADSAEEEWLAINLINAETEISFEAFPEMQNPNYLEDVFYKVYYQNPYILGLTNFTYDYNTFTLKVDYCYDKDTILQKQKEITTEADKIVSEVIDEKMSDEEKRLALYDYLENNCEYEDDALAMAEENDYVKSADGTFEDAFNTYGIIVNKKGVCQSYAYAYKLLCAKSGLECKVVTGYLNGNLPHAWSAVEIEGKWYQVDTTNNINNSGVPYFLYNADSDVAEFTGFTQDNLFELDSQLQKYSTDDDTYEYYYSNGLVIENLADYGNILDEVISEENGIISVRYVSDNYDEEELIKTVKESYNKKGLEDKLDNLGFYNSNGYLVIVQN